MAVIACYCTKPCPCKTYCVGSQDEPHIAHAFSHVSTLLPLCARLVWHWLFVLADIRGPLNWQGLGRQCFSGAQDYKLPIISPRQMQVVVSYVCWKVIVTLCVCVNGRVVESHQMTIVDYVYDVGQWSSPPAPDSLDFLTFVRGLF